MRILFLGLNYSPELTGVGKYSGEMMEWLASRGHDVRVVTAPPYYPAWKVSEGYSRWRYRREVSPQGVRIYRCPLWVPATPDGFRRIMHLSSFAVSSLPVMLGMTAWHPDLVLTVEPAFMCAPVALLVARICGAASWLHIQDFEIDAAFELGILPPNGWMKRLARKFERAVVRGFSRVSTISARMMDGLTPKGVEASRAWLFPNWVDVRSIHPQERPSGLRAELGIAADSTVLLYSGNMGAKQGLQILPEVAELLKSHRDLHFVFCGDGPYRSQLAKEVSGLQNVSLLPLQPIERLNDLLNLADIHMLPQRADAGDLVMPSKLTGMLASGRPVIATAGSGMQIASALDGKGIIVTPGNPDVFAAAILALADAPEVRKRMGRAARAFAERELAQDAVLGRFEAEIEGVCESRVAAAV